MKTLLAVLVALGSIYPLKCIAEDCLPAQKSTISKATFTNGLVSLICWRELLGPQLGGHLK